jgi:hypothetical protein
MTWRTYWRRCKSAQQSTEDTTDVIAQTSRLQLIMATVFSILSFMPLYISSTTGAASGSAPGPTNSPLNTTSSTGSDDYYLDLETFGHNPYLREAAMACLVICIIPGVDTFLDILPPAVTKAVFLEEKRLTKGHNHLANMIRLTLAERAMFIIGRRCEASYCCWRRASLLAEDSHHFDTLAPC